MPYRSAASRCVTTVSLASVQCKALMGLHTDFAAYQMEFQRAYVGSSNYRHREGDSGSDVQRIEVKQSVRTAILECRLTLTWTS
jgi:hypothetical protein